MARLIDLTRSLSRAGRMPTGVDRVERAYLDRFLADDVPVHGLIRTGLGFLLLDRAGLVALRAGLDRQQIGPRGLLARLARRLDAPQQAALTLARRHAIARCVPRGLPRMLRRHLPRPAALYNLGHSNLAAGTLAAMAALRPDLTIHVLIHDTIPLDHPQFQRPGATEIFARRLRAALTHADRIICNSHQTADRVTAAARDWGFAPPAMVVAHLGVVPAQPDPGALPPGLDLAGPFFVTLGTIEPRKNHALLLDIWDSWPGPPPDLFICGSRGWENRAVFDRLDRGISGVHELSGLRDGAIAALLDQSHGLLFPSLAEGFGLPPIEAAARGIPIVCGDLAIWHEVLGTGPVYLNPSDRYAWQTAIERLAKEKERPRTTPRIPPDWEAHFKAVLTRG